MAKKAQINISINTQNAIKSIADLDSEIGGSVNSIGDLRTTVDALTTELESAEYGTARWQELKGAVLQANTELKNYELSVEALDNEQFASELKSVAGGLMDVVGGMVLFGASSKSMEKVIQTFAKVEAVTRGVTGAMEVYASGSKVLNSVIARSAAAQTAMAAATTASGTAASGAALKFKALTAVIKANPLVAVASAIIAVVSAIALFSSSSETAEERTERLTKEQEKLTEAFESSRKSVVRLNEALAEFKGLENLEEVLNIERDLIDAENELTDILRDRPESYNEILSAQQKVNNLRLKMVKEEKVARITAFEEETELIQDRIENIKIERQAILDSERKETDAGQTRLSQLFDELEALEVISLRRQDNLATGEKNIEQKVLELELDNKIAQTEIDNANKIQDIEAKIRQEKLESLKDLTEQEREIFWELNQDKRLVIENTFNKEIERAKENLERIKEFTEENSEERIEAEKRYNAAVLAAARKKNASLLELSKETSKKILEQRKQDTLKAEIEILKIKTRMFNETGTQLLISMAELHQKEKDLLRMQMEWELSNEQLTADEKLKIREEYNLKIAQMDADFNAQFQADTEGEVEAMTSKTQALAESILKFYDKIAATVQTTLDTIQIAWDIAAENQTAKLEEEYRNQVDAAEVAHGERLISEKELNNQLVALEDEKADKERALRMKSFRQQKNLNIVNAVMNGALSVLQALANMPPPLSYVLATVNAALAGIQVGIISSQEFTANRGGKVPGQPSAIDSVDAVLAPGEMVINAASSSMFPNLLSDINQAGGGIPLAPEKVGGETNSNNIYQPQQGPIKAYVVESELSRTSKRVRRMEDAASFS